MKIKNILFALVILLNISSCKKNRTEYLTQIQKNIIDSFNEGDKFTMLKNNTDTLNFVVTYTNYSVSSNGYWYENGGPHTWTERGLVKFETTNVVDKEEGKIKVDGESTRNAVSVDIDSKIFTTKFEEIGNKEIDNVNYSNIFLSSCCPTSDILNDSAYYSLEAGLIKVWNNDVVYQKID